MHEPIRVAIVQAPSAFFDLPATLEQTLRLTEEAAGKGARLVVFGETWLGGYPAWLDHCPGVTLWDHPPAKEVYALYRHHSPSASGPEAQRLAEAAADLGITLVVGVSERVDRGPGNGTLYNSLWTFDGDRGLVNHHRKLVPTYTERLIWGPGDGNGLRTVDTVSGARVGGLICWEHWMPLARQALHVDGELIHVAVWPTVHDMHQVASRHYAFEGRCFVLAAGQLMTAGAMPEAFERRPGLAEDDLVLRGGSAIIGPDGSYLVEPVFERSELLMADLDPAQAEGERMTLDVTGHYSRPDVFDFGLRPNTARSNNDIP